MSIVAKYFTPKELECKCGCGGLPKQEFVSRLDKLREKYGKPMKVSSGYRCPAHNKAVGGSPNSRHMTGEAADILLDSAESYKVAKLAYEMGFGGIGVAKTFLHLDIREPKEGRLWTY